MPADLPPTVYGVDLHAAYRVEAQHQDPNWAPYTDAEGWVAVAAGSQHYCWGFIHARADLPFRVAHRVRHVKTGRICEDLPALLSGPLGMVAGMPTQEQYVAAALRLLKAAGSLHPRDLDPDLTRAVEAAMTALEAPRDR